MDEVRKFWAYKHVDGGLKVRPYRGKSSEDAIDDASDSDFVADVFGPFSAKNFDDACRITREHFVPHPAERGEGERG